ncbi:glycosyltransferase family 39 protein [Salinibacterium hongtaonis]|nr:glycosyltransferase family 39 protein [Salinibacterium hongtaonis]
MTRNTQHTTRSNRTSRDRRGDEVAMSGTALIGQSEAAFATASTRRGRNTRSAALVGLGAAAISMTGSGIPSYWGDEAASVISADRPLPTLLAELGTVDAVHGAYYLFLHYWIGLVGTSEFAVRLPSAIAIGLGAAGVVVLARRLSGSGRFAVASGLIFAILPLVTRMGSEARSYAFGIAAAVWLAAAFVRLVRSRETRIWPWILLGAGGAASTYVFLYLVLLIPVFGVGMLALRPARAIVMRWLASAGVAIVLAAPIMIAAVSQRQQVEFLARRDYATVESVLVTQWFGSGWFAVLAWALIAAAVAGAVMRRESRPRLAFLLAWLVIPTAAVMVANFAITPLYNPRYLSFSTPAVAILMAEGVRVLAGLARGRSARRLVATAAAVALVVTALPGYVEQRSPFSRDEGSDLREAAAIVAEHASPGDAIVFDESVRPSRKPRLAIDLYPEQFAGLHDVALVTPARERDTIWAEVAPLRGLGVDLRDHQTVWALQLAGSSSTDMSTLETLGFRLVQAIPVNRTVLYEFTREAP